MRFFKMQALGNDYIYIDCLKFRLPEKWQGREGELSSLLSSRRFGIGGDGVVLILPHDRCDCQMSMFNADGSEGAMCGNAIRCVARYLFDSGIAPKRLQSIATKSGVKHLYIEGSSITCNMGEPCFNPKLIPMHFEGNAFIDAPIQIGKRAFRATALSMGNPHMVIFTRSPSRLRLDKIGPLCESHPLFPQRVNTEFCAVKREGIHVRVFERGSGETLACGTGACAAVVAAVTVGLVNGNRHTVILRGGRLEVEYLKSATVADVYLTGGCGYLFYGETSLAD